MKLRKITETDLQGVGVVGMADTPNLSARQMQEKVEEVVRAVVIPVINENIDYTATKQDLADAVYNAGAGDMQASAYDSNLDGIVNRADNGIFEYTHSKNGTVHNLQGSGEYIAFYPTADWNPGDTLTINGQVVNCRNEKSERVENEELFKYAGFTVCYHRYGECFFKLGGAGLNFKVVGGTTQPASPKENTIWVNTNVTIHDYIFSTDEPSVKSLNKNLIVMDGKTTTINGITFTVNNNDKSITINGTSTAGTEYRLQSHHLNDVLNAGRKYTFNNTPNSNIAMGIHERKANDGGWIKNLSQAFGGGQTFTYPGPTEPGNEFYAFIYIPSGKTISNVTVYPQLEEGTTPTSYVAGNGLGFVWIKTGNASSVELSVLRKGKEKVNVKLSGCYIYRNTTDKWVRKDPVIYINGQWKNWYSQLIDNGSYASLSAWTNTGGTMTNNTTYNDTRVVLLHTVGSRIVEMISEDVDMTDFSTLEFDVITSEATQAYQNPPYVGYRYGVIAATEAKAYPDYVDVTTHTGKYAVSKTGAYQTLSTVKLDITSLKGKYKVAVANQSSGGGWHSYVGVANVRLV